MALIGDEAALSEFFLSVFHLRLAGLFLKVQTVLDERVGKFLGPEILVSLQPSIRFGILHSSENAIAAIACDSEFPFSLPKQAISLGHFAELYRIWCFHNHLVVSVEATAIDQVDWEPSTYPRASLSDA